MTTQIAHRNDQRIGKRIAQRISRRIIVRLVAVLALAFVVPLLHVESASAAQALAVSGRPGYVSLNGPMITGYDMATRLSNGTYFYSRSFETSGITVGRSSAYTGTQYVYVTYRLQDYSGGWRTWQQRSYHGYVAANGTLSFPRWVYNPASVANNRAAYRFTIQISWYHPTTSQLLGQEVLIPNNYYDTKCQTQYLRCNAYTDGIFF